MTKNVIGNPCGEVTDAEWQFPVCPASLLKKTSQPMLDMLHSQIVELLLVCIVNFAIDTPAQCTPIRMRHCFIEAFDFMFPVSWNFQLKSSLGKFFFNF